MILKAVGKARLIQTEPAPDVRVEELGSDSNSYAVRFWLSRFERDVDCRGELLVSDRPRDAASENPDPTHAD